MSSNRGLMMVSVVSGLLAIIIFIMVISAYAGSGGGPATTGNARATTGQPVDSEQAYGAPETSSTLAPGPTVAPVQQQAQSSSSQQSVEAPAASAPPNPFTAGIK